MSRPPLWFIPLILICLMFGLYISPERLIELGPLRNSLTSDIASVKQIAFLEVSIMRGLSIGFALFLGLLWLVWQPLQHSRLIQYIQTSPAETAAFNAIDHSYNRSFWIVFAAVLLSLAYVGIAPSFLSAEQMFILIQEDGFVEWSSALLLIISSAYAFKLAFDSKANLLQKIMLILLALLFFLMAGEEISWGQRIFDIETPAALKEINVQGEINFHNLLGYFFDHIFIAAIFSYGFLLPFLAHYYPIFSKACGRFGIPLASYGLAWGFLMLSCIHDWTVFRIFPPVAEFASAELRELLTDIALLLLIHEHRLRLTNQTKNP